MARLHREKMSWLLGQIVSGEYEEGELLPPEVELAAGLGVSRGVVREVIRALEERGVVSVRHGSGARVALASDWNVLDPEVLSAVLRGPDGRTILLELHECRALLEVGAAGFAARSSALSCGLPTLRPPSCREAAAHSGAASTPGARRKHRWGGPLRRRAVVAGALNRSPPQIRRRGGTFVAAVEFPER